MFNGERASVLQDEESSGEDGGDGCTTMGTYVMPLDLKMVMMGRKMVKVVNFMCTLSQLKIIIRKRKK